MLPFPLSTLPARGEYCSVNSKDQSPDKDPGPESADDRRPGGFQEGGFHKGLATSAGRRARNESQYIPTPASLKLTHMPKTPRYHMWWLLNEVDASLLAGG